MTNWDAEERLEKPVDPTRTPRSRGGSASNSGNAERSAERGARAGEPRAWPHLTVKRLPELYQPVLVMAFEGWNDAGEAATTAARLIVSERDGEKFAWVDPEEFFVFTDTRPHVRLTRRGRRRIDWPANEFLSCPAPSDDPSGRDLIVLLGTEPDLRWRAFGDMVFEVAKATGVRLVIALGALNEEIPHTIPPRVSGSAANADLHPLLADLGLRTSKYEGPTGIVGVLTGRFADAGYPVANLWGHAPHYISASPNPVVAVRILREVRRVLGITLDTEMLDEAAQRFDEQVREAVAKDPEASAYVRDLERQYQEGRGGDGDAESDGDEGGGGARAAGELPSGAAMVDALEEFLRKRQRRRPQGGQ